MQTTKVMKAGTKVEDLVVRRRFTGEEYRRMGEVGILREDERVELLDGEVVEMNPIGGLHATGVRESNRLFSKRVGDELRVDVQSSLSLGEYGEPQPDLAVIRAREYGADLPGPEDVLLVVEVADTSVAYDRGIKLPMYARAGIREAWLVDIPAGRVERHTEPSETGYRLTARAGRGERLESLVLTGFVLEADAVLGPR